MDEDRANDAFRSHCRSCRRRQVRVDVCGEGQVIPHEGEYREITRPHKLVFTWKSAGAGDTVVTIAFAKVGDRKTKLTLTHERFVSEGARDGHRSGWAGILEKVEQTMEARV
jgi:uncharacterized protein YndB with AHSA1/START domain